MIEVAPEYVAARAVLLDALEALGSHRENVVLGCAGGVSPDTGATTLNVPVMTTDADLALDTRLLSDDPEIGASLRNAGFAPGANPGHWIGAGDVAVDLMVVPYQANTQKQSARSARIPPHEAKTARITPGLEPALVDCRRVDCRRADIGALSPQDHRRFTIRVAGPAALLVAKAIKLEERLRAGRPPTGSGERERRTRRLSHPASSRDTGTDHWFPFSPRRRTRRQVKQVRHRRPPSSCNINRRTTAATRCPSCDGRPRRGRQFRGPDQGAAGVYGLDGHLDFAGRAEGLDRLSDLGPIAWTHVRQDEQARAAVHRDRRL